MKYNEDKIPDSTILATNTTLNAKLDEIKGKIPSITNLATTTITTVENETPNVSNLVKKKTDYNTEVSEIENKIATDHNHHKYIATQEFNELIPKRISARLPQANLASKNIDIADFCEKADFDDKLNNLNMISLQIIHNMILLKKN